MVLKNFCINRDFELVDFNIHIVKGRIKYKRINGDDSAELDFEKSFILDNKNGSEI